MSRLNPWILGALLFSTACATTGPRPEGAGEPPEGDAYVDYAPQDEAWRETRPEPGPFPEIVIPTFEAGRLPNGMTLLVSPRPDLPLVSARVVVQAGSGAEPPHMAGLADLSYEMLLEGAGDLDALALSDAFADLGTSASVSTGPDGASIGGDVLTRNLDAFLALLATVVQQPRLEEAGFARQKAERLADLARAVGSPQYLAQQAVPAVLYGDTHPYGHIGSGTPETVGRVALKDVRRFLEAFAGPKNAALVLTGDVDAATARALAQKHFGDWRTRSQTPSAPQAPQVGDREQVVLVPKPGLGQTVLAVGRPLVAAGHPDEWALQVANAAYGGQFVSRLNMNLREDKGYTYGAFSNMDPRWGVGPFFAYSSVRADVTGPALKEVMAELEGLHERPITQEEFDDALSGIIRSIPGWFETVQGLAGSAASLFNEHQPMDRYEQMLAAYEALTLDQVRKAAADYLTPATMRVVLVGDPEIVQTQVPELDLGELVTREPPAPVPAGDATAAR